MINCLTPAVTILQAFSRILGAVSQVGHTCHPVTPTLLAVTSSDPLSTSKRVVCWYRYSHCCTFFQHLFKPSPCDEWACQAASGVTSSYDALLELFECLGNFLTRLEIYTTIPPTPILTDVMVKIMVELLSVLALASKQIKEGRFSTCNVRYITCRSMYHREVRKKVARGDQDRERGSKTGSIDAGRGSDNYYTDLGCRPWPRGKCKGGHGRCVMVTRLLSKHF